MSAAAEMPAAELPDRAWWVALAGLAGMGPIRLRALHESLSAHEAWRTVLDGRAHTVPAVAAVLGAGRAETAAQWAQEAAEFDVIGWWQAHAHLGISVLGDPTHPARLAEDLDPPVLMFSEGDRSALEGPKVAIIGTRRCTEAGADVATELGTICARAGVRVVTGLTAGIESAALRGALSIGPGAAPPIGLAPSGLDVVSPPSSQDLWRQVAAEGVMLSEYPLGTRAVRWRFPARNRLVAALAEVIVVVESQRADGCLFIVDEALRRDRPVLVVPGPIRSPASAGTNRLLSEGAAVLCETDEVLAALAVTPTAHVSLPRDVGGGDRRADDPRPAPDEDGGHVLRALGWTPVSLDTLAQRTGLGLAALALALDRLEVDGWIRHDAGRIEQIVTPKR